MSEERLDRLESHVSKLEQDVTVLKEDVAVLKEDVTILKKDVVALNQNVNALREDMTAMRHRMDSFESTILTAVNDGFNSLRNYIDDLNYDLADNERKTRRLARRVSRLERRDREE
jgi:chromosome segregation ATPase